MANHCEHCGQKIRQYKRGLNKGITLTLLALHKLNTNEFTYYLDFATPGGATDFSIARFWGLIEAKPVVKGENNSGYWRLTEHGKAFLNGQASIQKYIHVRDGQLQEYSGPDLVVGDIVNQFDYNKDVVQGYA